MDWYSKSLVGIWAERAKFWDISDFTLRYAEQMLLKNKSGHADLCNALKIRTTSTIDKVYNILKK